MADIGIVGYGFVGQAVANGFKEKNNILYYDKYKDTDSLEHVVESSEFIFVCLPTPFKEGKTGRGIDLSIMDENIAQIAQKSQNTDKIIIIKSTVVPGTTESYAKCFPNNHFAFNPEFLREAHYLDDFMNPDRTVIGVLNNQIGRKVNELYTTNFPDHLIFLTDPTTAEVVKYMANAFLAMKVMFANEFYDICQKLGISYNEAKEMVIADRRIGPTHLDVTSERGFGGKCFPKDLIAIIEKAKELNVDVPLLELVEQRNREIRRHHDWLEIPFVKTEEGN